jgi:hypothetical protein
MSNRLTPAAAVEIRHADLRTQAATDATHGYAYLTPDGMVLG